MAQAATMDRLDRLPAELHIEILTQFLLKLLSDILKTLEGIYRERPFFKQAEVSLAPYLGACPAARQCWRANRLFILRRVNAMGIQPGLKEMHRKQVRARFRHRVWLAHWNHGGYCAGLASKITKARGEFSIAGWYRSYWLGEAVHMLRQLSTGESCWWIDD
jgi:hypothetical protein